MTVAYRSRIRRLWGALASTSAVAFATSGALAADPANGRLLAAQCAQCHGAKGFESLAGEEYAEIVEEMLEMARPSETGSIMKHQAKGYTQAQVKLIAAYFSSLPKARSAAVTASASGAAPAAGRPATSAGPATNATEN